ncbi:MAG: MFS transporter [Candidatus Methanoplasma sp.]|jgi:sugar phosphate permease|nr:MFS transporter [Candidatus Methanoplasma sp.]
MRGAEESIRRYGWYIFIILASAYFFVYFQRMAVGIVGRDVVAEAGGSIGILSAAYFWTYAAMQIPSGMLSDRLGPRAASSAFLAMAAAGSFLTAAAWDFGAVVLGKMMIAAGMAVVYVPLAKSISIWFGKSEFPQLNGIVIAVGNVGAIAASAPLDILASSVGWRETFMVLGIASLSLAALCAAAVRDRPPGPAGEKAAGDPPAPWAEGLRAVLSGGRRFWPVAMSYFFVYGTIMVFQGTWAKTYFGEVHGFAAGAAWLVLAIGLGKIAGTVSVGLAAGRGLAKSPRRVMLLGSACFAGVWAAVWLAGGGLQSYWIWMAACLAFGFFGGFMTLSFTQVKEANPDRMSGTAVSMVNFFLFLGAAACTTLTDPIIGTGYAAESFSAVWGIMFAFSSIAVLLVYLSRERDASRGES